MISFIETYSLVFKINRLATESSEPAVESNKCPQFRQSEKQIFFKKTTFFPFPLTTLEVGFPAPWPAFTSIRAMSGLRWRSAAVERTTW